MEREEGSDSIARELTESDAQRTNGDKLVVEAGLWITLILLLCVVWVIVSGLTLYG
jgi:hypothetical protein